MCIIYYDTKNEEIISSNYEKLKSIFCESCDDIQNFEKIFDSHIKKGFIVEISYDKEINKQVTKYYIKDMSKLLKSNKSFINNEIVRKINISLRKQKLERITNI